MGGFTNFPSGLSSLGFPVIPPIPIAEDSVIWFLDAGAKGSDSNVGLSPDQPLKTLAAAYGKLRSGHYDTIFIIGLGTAVALTGALVWSKSYCNLVGLCGPLMSSQRARVTNGSTLMTPMVTFSGNGNVVRNVQFANFGSHATQAAVSVLVTGDYNYFENCHFAGGGGTLAAADASMRSLVITGPGGENLFRNCTIGLDTVLRGNTANAELEITAQSPRNTFENCHFIKWGQGSGLFALMGANAIDRWVIFDKCTFTNFTGGGGGSLTNAYTVNATQNGVVIMRLCLFVGMTALPASTLVFADPTAANTVIMKGLSPA
jgi:hypothetical protein